MHKRIAGVAVVAALMGGVSAAPQAGAVSTRVVSQAAAQHFSITGTHVSGVGSASTVQASGRSGQADRTRDVAQTQLGAIVKAACKAFVAAVKRYGPAAFNALKSAVSRGWTAFRDFVNGLPGLVKRAIEAIGLSTAYDWLKGHWNEWAN